MSGASPRGTYKVIAEVLRDDLDRDGTTGPLPSEAELMRLHAVSRNTIRRALRVLEAEGKVQSVPGVGWRTGGQDALAPLVDRLTGVIDGVSPSPTAQRP